MQTQTHYVDRPRQKTQSFRDKPMPTQAWQASEPNTRPMGRSTRHCHLNGLQESVRTRTVGRQEAGHMAHMLLASRLPKTGGTNDHTPGLPLTPP